MYQIKKASVIGAGTMGLGIAGQLANAGIDVLLLDLPSNEGNRNAICERAIEECHDISNAIYGSLSWHPLQGLGQQVCDPSRGSQPCDDAISQFNDSKRSAHYARLFLQAIFH